jgi:hypothetical protein
VSARERPILFSAPMVRAILAGAKTQTRRVVRASQIPSDGDRTPRAQWCPYGAAGDTLWVRETWAAGPPSKPVFYRASESAGIVEGTRWRPSIFMRRTDSRIALDVLEVRVERLQDITDAAIAAEGFAPTLAAGEAEAFGAGWDAINRKRAPWASNPWVWVVTFRRVGP